jgi:hypothetical protein
VLRDRHARRGARSGARSGRRERGGQVARAAARRAIRREGPARHGRHSDDVRIARLRRARARARRVASRVFETRAPCSSARPR